MISSRTKKIVLLLSITFAACGAGLIGYTYYRASQGPIYNFNAARDTQPIMDIFNKNWYWLLASEHSTPGLMLKHLTHDVTNPITYESLHIKVLRIDDKLAGFTAYYMEAHKQGRLLFLAVDEEFRGHGYGKFLAEYAMKDLFKMGATHIALWTRLSNLPAQKIYKELGFIEAFDDNGYIFFEYWPNN